MNQRRRTHLTLVGPGDALTGVAPSDFERASKSCQVGDALHRGLVNVSITLARHGLRRVVAPSARPPLLRALATADAWVAAQVDLKPVRRERSHCFNVLHELEQTTRTAIQSSLRKVQHSSQNNDTAHPLDPHAESVLWRYVSLSVRLASEAVILTLDGVTKPESLASVVQQVAAARAYQAAGLGAVRQPELRVRAREQAEFECRELLSVGHGEEMLAIQLFHEFLGVRWKVLHDAERAYIDAFVKWAMTGSAVAG